MNDGYQWACGHITLFLLLLVDMFFTDLMLPLTTSMKRDLT